MGRKPINKPQVDNIKGRPAVIQSPDELLNLWNEYKTYCDNKPATITEFSNRLGDFVTKTVIKPISYTIEGFAVFCGLSRQSFYDTYINPDSEINKRFNSAFADILSHVRDECIMDIKGKLEQGVIDSKLAGIMLGRYKDMFVLPSVAKDDVLEQTLSKVQEVLDKMGGNI